MRSVVSFFVRLKILEGVFTNFLYAFYFTRSKVMSHHHSLHDSPLQESGSAGLTKINLPSKLTPGKHPNLAPNFGSCISRSVSILRPEERLTHFFTKKNPQAWFTYFDSLCDRNGLLDDQAKIDALVPCLDSNTFLSVQPLLNGTHSFGDIKDF